MNNNESTLTDLLKIESEMSKIMESLKEKYRMEKEFCQNDSSSHSVENEQIPNLTAFNQRFEQAYNNFVGSSANTFTNTLAEETFVEKEEPALIPVPKKFTPAPIAESKTESDTNIIPTAESDILTDTKKLEKQKGKRSLISIISSVFFYVVIIGAVLLAFVSTGKSDGPRDIFGFSYFTVLSGSMQKEIPKGSFVLTKKVDPNELKIGDNITFMKNQNITVTHKITTVYENYNGSGQRRFQTRGVNNAQPDSDLVDPSNIVGKVIFSIPGIGSALSFLSENLMVALIFLGLLLLLSFALQAFFKAHKEEKQQKNPNLLM